MSPPQLLKLEDYEPYVDAESLDRIRAKAAKVRGRRVAHMNSTYYAGGVVEILTSMVTLMNQLGINTEWRLLRGTPAFFEVTREMHDAIQNENVEFNLTDEKKRIYEEQIYRNAFRNQLDHDAVFMHDHHTMGMAAHFHKRGPWIWRCHLDLTTPHPDLIAYLEGFADLYDAIVFILEDYMQDWSVPQYGIMPAIDPTKIKSQMLSEREVYDRLSMYDIPTDLPIVTQISRFDQWKDPHGVVDAFRLAQKDGVKATLVLLGNRPSDDPDENPIFDRLIEQQDERMIVIDKTDMVLVSALQQHATVVLQKSLREGFGLTVSEALWKGTPVIGGNVGGITKQIDHGTNGFLVDSPEQAAEHLIDLLNNPEKAKEMGAQGREKVRKNFLITRLLEDHLTLLGSFEPSFTPTM